MSPAFQTDLFDPPAPAVDPRDVRSVMMILYGRDWMTAEEILRALGRPETESGRRWVRGVASASEGQILSYPSSPGYRITREASLEEIQAARTIKHQADRMTARYLEIERVYHGKL